ncbi:TonB-dependent siderophore receptor [Coraliomargarita parva]|uniref:TonB-dependent siderophore receptor n=1 Tax=Coraliomargarita parva TaxID=3014050 RepID=UPI0022B5640C|nr:TonB-dependent siderophore receptor [Coraliomargarita parva]
MNNHALTFIFGRPALFRAGLGLLAASCLHGLSAEVADESQPVDSLSETTLVGAEAEEAAASTYKLEGTSRSATRLGLAPEETPQSISVLTGQQLEDFGLTDLNDALLYAPGVNVESVETDRTYYTARGFDITNFQIDGLGLPLAYGNIVGSLDTAIYERVEVLRGANGLTAGTGNPSATINLIRKRPESELSGSFSLSYGSWDQMRAQADISVPITEDGRVRSRLVAVKEEGDSYLDLYAEDNLILYGIVEVDLTDRTLLSFGHSYEDSSVDSPLWGALPLIYTDGSKTDYDVSTTTSAEWAYWDNTIHTTFLQLDQQLGENWSAKAELSYMDVESDSALFYMYGTPDPSTGLGLYAYPSFYTFENEQFLANLALNGTVELFERDHDLVAGFSYAKSDIWARSDYGMGIGTPIPVPLEDWGGDYAEPAFTAAVNGAEWEEKEYGYYAAARLNPMDRLKLILGARLVTFERDGQSYGVSQSAEYENELIPYAGVLFDLTESFTAYASYTEIFTPQSELDINYKLLDPIEGNSYELGLKSTFLEGDGYAALSVFHTEQENVAEAAGMNGTDTYYEAVPGLTSEGLEFELVGRFFDALTLSGSYSYVRIEDDAGDRTNLYTPKQLVRVAATYEVPNTKLTLGAGARWQSQTSTEVGGFQVTQEDYIVFDLLAKYRITENLTASVNLYNLTDEKYYSSLYWTQAFYGAPRSLVVGLDWSF